MSELGSWVEIELTTGWAPRCPTAQQRRQILCDRIRDRQFELQQREMDRHLSQWAAHLRRHFK